MLQQEAMAGASPPGHEDQAIDALCHMGAALRVLELYAGQHNRALVSAARDLLQGYQAKAHRAVAARPAQETVDGVLRAMSQDLGHAIGLLERLNEDDADGEILHAVSHLLKSAKHCSDARGCGASGAQCR